MPGLRREEVAQLASISTDYYARLEQGRLPSASESTLAAIATVLGLDRGEELYLRRLAKEADGSTDSVDDQVHTLTRRLLDNLTATPAVVLDRRMHVLAWNAMASAFFIDFSAVAPAQRNWVRMTFCDNRMRNMYAEWGPSGRACVALLRMLTVGSERDPQLEHLVTELSALDADFRLWWSDVLVSDMSTGDKRYRHPRFGEVTLDWQMLEIVGGAGHTLHVMSGEPGSITQRALRTLELEIAAQQTDPA